MNNIKLSIKKKMRVICEHRTKYLSLAILSIIGCLVFSTLLSDFIFYNMAVYHNVRVSGYPGEDTEEYPAVIDNAYVPEESIFGQTMVQEKKYGFYSWEQLQDAIVESNDITYVDSEESEYGYAYYRLNSPESYIEFRLPVYMNTCLTLVFGEKAFPVIISDEKEGISKYYSYGAVGAGCIKPYLYNLKICIYVYIWYAIGYIGMFVILFLMLSGIALIYETYISRKFIWNQLHPFRLGMLIAAIYITYAALQYYFHWDLLQVGEGADAYYYMNPDIWDKHGNFSLEKTAGYLFTFRGYFTIAVAIATNTLSNIFGVEPIYFYFIYYGIITAFTIVSGMPKLYQYLTGKQATDKMCLLTYAIFFLFWNNFYFFALTDIPAAMFAISGIAWMLEGIREEKNKHIFLGSIFLGISVNYRNAYNYVLYFTIFWMVLEIVQKKKKACLKKVAAVSGCVIVGILLVSWPQAVINFERGHIGLFTYDSGWIYDARSGNIISALKSDITTALHQYNVFSDPRNRDIQLFQIDQPYYTDKYYSLGDMVYIILANPLQFLLGYAKKVFWAFSIGIESAYGAIQFPYYIKEFAKLFHFYLIGNFIYILFSDKLLKYFKIKNRIWFIGMGAVTVALQGALHIEKRYFLFYFLLIYFANGFLLSNFLQDKKINGQGVSCKYIFSITVFVFAGYVLEKLIEYNFA